MVLTTTSERAGRWGFLDRFAWSATASLALATDHDAHALVDGPRGLARERVGLWPDGTPGTTPDAAHPDTEVLERAGERTLAGHRAKRPRPAVFVDRDGTLIREEGYLSDPRKVEVLPGVARGLRALLDAGIPVVVATNQSGIGRGYYTAESVYEVMAVMRRMLRAEGVELTAIYLCPHAPGAGCPCRKPRPGLLERAAEDLVLDLPGSVMIGDKLSDVATGHHAGSRGVLVRTGYGAAEESAAHGAARAPDAVVDDVGVAAEWVLERS
ncbi:MAG: HAD family hydrolase [Candidatus Eisenbacteria bacterium]|uniref:D,D-heptose 1,7-bisphosphate phosphatase n=1 Tax=Eiseniibacteriota bacterium TaxID=2212470 RepID=A0A9D6LCK1_UNCEI|nr:HAD family hydrolase [Candidatus Eisenbacteria bacterium]MBI3540224.1 HAD family hydrolase [Candidatus Eisenbacteria bacterium]